MGGGGKGGSAPKVDYSTPESVKENSADVEAAQETTKNQQRQKMAQYAESRGILTGQTGLEKSASQTGATFYNKLLGGGGKA